MASSEGSKGWAKTVDTSDMSPTWNVNGKCQLVHMY